jgi:hypothetical protein
MTQKMVSFVYTDGRTKPPPGYVLTMGEERVKEMLDRGDPIELYSEEVAPAPTPEPTPDPEPEIAPEGDEKDGWPDGYTFKKRGAYVAVSDPDGNPVLSLTPSGKFKGEDAAQEAAWLHKGEN